MSILIKWIDKPKNCHECPFLYVTAVCDGSTPCPIFELPPHGDLIDKRKMLMHISDIQFSYADMGTGGNKAEYDFWQKVFDFVADAPIVVEGEDNDG